MAKTFNVDDPAHHEAYLTEAAIQMTLYGNLYIRRGEGGWITILDGAELPDPDPGQPGFALVMDDGDVLPVPEAAS